MLTIRSFRNTDIKRILHLWNKKGEEFPGFFTSLTAEILESQVLGNVLFDPNGFLFAEEEGNTLGMVHAAFVPNTDGTGPSYESGIIYSPIVLPGIPNRAAVTLELITAAEKYLCSRGVKHWFAGGYANASPFYTVLYGRVNPQGILADDELVIDAFEQAGCRSFDRSRLFQLPLADYLPETTRKIHEAHRIYTVQGFTWNADKWWEMNVFRNFSSTEWIVFHRSDNAAFPDAVAGALVHRMVKNIYSLQRADEPIHLFLSYIGVVPHLLRMGIGSLLFARLTGDILSEEIFPVILDTIVSEKDVGLASFLTRLGFQERERVISLHKSEI